MPILRQHSLWMAPYGGGQKRSKKKLYGAKNPDESQLNFGVVKDMYVKNKSTFEYVPTLVGTYILIWHERQSKLRY